MPLVFRQVVRIYNHIVEVNLYEFSYVLSKDFIHESLESCQYVVQPERHYFELVLSISS